MMDIKFYSNWDFGYHIDFLSLRIYPQQGIASPGTQIILIIFNFELNIRL